MNKHLLGFLLLVPLLSRSELSPREIMVKNEDARKLATIVSSASILTGETTEGEPNQKHKEFTWWRKLQEDHTHYNTLTRFHKPAEIKGQGILFLERNKNQNDVLMYLPTYKKIRRVEASSQSSSFMGSVFSYSDITTSHVDDYTYKLLKSEACPGETAVQCYVVETKPATDEVKERSGYNRSTLWVRHDNFMTQSGEHFDTSDGLWKRFRAGRILEVDTKNKKWMAHEIKMVDLKGKRFTLLKFENVKVTEAIPPQTFTQENLARVK